MLATCTYTCDFCWVVLRILQKNALDESQRHEVSGFCSYINVSDVTSPVCYKPRVFKIEKEILKRLYPWNSQIRYPKKTLIFPSCANETRKESKWYSFFNLAQSKNNNEYQKNKASLIVICYFYWT